MRNPENIVRRLTELFQRLLKEPMLKKGEKWKDDLPGWGDLDRKGVYLLWRRDDDINKNIPAVYVGEGLLGARIWESFYNKNRDWQYAQLFTDDVISGDSKECRFWRKALERFCILVFEPKDNIR